MKKIKLFLLILIVTELLADNYLSGQITSNEVDALVTNAMEKFKVAGAAVAIVKDGKIKTFNLFEEQINGAAGGILSNIEDMSKWMIMQLNKGKYEQNYF